MRPLSSTRRAVTALAAAGALGAAGLVGATPASSVPGGPAAHLFWPNPVQSLGDESLTDQNDSNAAVPLAAYHTDTLPFLDTSGTLTGTYAKVISSTGKAVDTRSDLTALLRHDDGFEQVMAYYWVTQAQLYIQSLGFGSTLPPVNARQQLIRVNQFGGDNSFYREGTGKLTITFGKGGVDDAEDAEVIIHEYGHSVQDNQVPGFGSTEEAGSIGEAFGDYLSVEVTNWRTGTPSTNEACVADWDSTSYTRGPIHCLRRIDGTKQYPADMVGEVHADGEIWSSALHQIRLSLGAPTADRIIIGAQFSFTPDVTFTQAAQDTVDYATTTTQKKAIQAAFAAHGIHTTV